MAASLVGGRLPAAGVQALIARPRPVAPAAVQRLRSRPAMTRKLAVQPQASAKLHDFCMSIPYGGIVAVGGVVSLLFGTQALGWKIAAAGAAVCVASALSLSTWRKGSSSAPFTVVSAGVASWLAYTSWERLQAGTAAVPWYGLLALSAALALFCVYNILAGGNPPSKKSSGGDVVVAAS